MRKFPSTHCLKIYDDAIYVYLRTEDTIYLVGKEVRKCKRNDIIENDDGIARLLLLPGRLLKDVRITSGRGGLTINIEFRGMAGVVVRRLKAWACELNVTNKETV